METEQSEWTKADLQKLLATIKTNITDKDRMKVFYQGVKSVDWDKVAFPPFSPEACQEKWDEMCRKMRKFRTLTELVVEAEDVISDPSQNQKIHPELPKTPLPPSALFYKENVTKFHKKKPNLKPSALMSVVLKEFKALPYEEKAKYKKKYQLAKDEYDRSMDKFREQYEDAPVHGEKRKKVSEHTQNGNKRHAKSRKTFPGEPKIPSQTANQIFFKETLKKTNVKLPRTSERFNKIHHMWKDLPNKEKERYKDQCDDLFRKYTKRLQRWFKTLTTAEQKDYRICNPSKCQYLDDKHLKTNNTDIHIISDSEDEDIAYSSSDEGEEWRGNRRSAAVTVLGDKPRCSQICRHHDNHGHIRPKVTT
ncbi:nucleolar transcription factor 1-like [Scomber japonicus]|uniref:nucleolar transcription factor 1-like n=1 Tax=Scomber japonicus TaxID=13676 RepID=UPI0023059322|nr:nucleolar transcription factor 1-like [Scomber japonicus]